MRTFTVKPAPKRRHVDLGSASVAVPAAASKIGSTEGAAADALSSSTDIIFEILSRLPVKTLCRFRCASKQWHSLISDPTFVAARESHAAEPLLVCRFGGASLGLVDMDGNVVRTMKGMHGPRMLCTGDDGLVCLAFNSCPDPQLVDIAAGETLLTRYQRAPPDRPDIHRRYDFGFGRTAVSQVYKVVRLIGSGRSFNRCQVLTLGDGAGWRQAQPPATPVRRTTDYQTPVAIHGVLHFLVSDEGIVLCFDLESEEWNKTIKCPEQGLLFDRTKKIIMGELNGSLCMARTGVHTHKYSRAVRTDIWLLNNDSGKDDVVWSKVYTIQMNPSVNVVKPLRMMRDGRKLLFCCYIHNVSSQPVLQVYDPSANRCMDVVVAPTGFTGIVGLCNLRLARFI